MRFSRHRLENYRQPHQHLYKAFKPLPDHLAGKRDHAIFLIGVVGAFRRSKLVSLNEEYFYGAQLSRHGRHDLVLE